MKISIIGSGRVAQALATGFLRNKHEVTIGSREPSKVNQPAGVRAASPKEATRTGEVVIFAVPYTALTETVKSIGTGEFKGKTVIDATNAVSQSGDLAIGFTTSGAEELAKLLPEAHVVKAFNTVFAKHMSSGKIGEDKLALLVAGDSENAKGKVMQLAGEIGFDPIDSGPLRVSRYLEPLGMLNIRLAFVQKMGPDIGFKLTRQAN